MTLRLALELGFLVGVIVASWLSGYTCGVRDTEERWSEAVGRADSHRQYEAEQREARRLMGVE